MSQLPLDNLDSLKEKESKTRSISWLLRISLCALIISLNLVINRSEKAAGISIALISFMVILYLMRFLQKAKKELLDSVKLVFIFTWGLYASIQLLHLRLDYWIIYSINIVSLGSGIYWFVVQGFGYFRNDNRNLYYRLSWKLSNIFLTIGVVTYLMFLINKTLHWPLSGLIGISASVFLIIGILLHVREE